MATTIRVKIANGHRPQIDSYIEAHPGITPVEGARLWVDERYGGWITGTLAATPDQFSLSMIDTGSFNANFDEDAHARRFLAEIGGQELRLEAL